LISWGYFIIIFYFIVLYVFPISKSALFVKNAGIRQSSLIRIDKEVIFVAQPVCRQAGADRRSTAAGELGRYMQIIYSIARPYKK